MLTRPILSWDFAKVRSLDPRVTFTRASTATYWDCRGVLRTAPAGQPRIDHDPITGQCRGLLVEGQTQNLLMYSADFTQWNQDNATVSANATTAPDGTLTADRIVEAAATGYHGVWRHFSGTPNTIYTFSVYAKAAERSAVQLWLSAGTPARATFDLLAGTAVVNTSGNFTGVTATIQPLPNGWFRLALTGTSPATVVSVLCDAFTVNSGVANGWGSPYWGIYLWGAQCEVGGYPTSYIPTAESQVTRAADTATVALAGVREWNGVEFVMVGQFGKTTNTGQYLTFLRVDNGGAGDPVALAFGSPAFPEWLTRGRWLTKTAFLNSSAFDWGVVLQGLP